MKSLLLLLLKGYKLCISPFLGQNCRFFPSCADYAQQAVSTHGAWRGSLLSARRLCKCHPWNPGGLDPVPPACNESHNHASGPAPMTRPRH